MSDEDLYLKVTDEVTNGKIDPALWAKAIAKALGDEDKGKYEYINLRVAQLKDSKTQADSTVKSSVQPIELENSLQQATSEVDNPNLNFGHKTESKDESTPSKTHKTSSNESVAENYDRFGGWLVLVGFGLIVSPIRLIWSLFPMYFEIFTNGSWEVLTTPGTDVYSSLWAPVLLAEIVLNCGLIISWIYAIYLFFQKKSAFPSVYIVIAACSLVFIILDALAIAAVLPGEPVFDADTSKELFRGFISAFIWIPYMRMSKRVKATFTRT
jgi:hypothetical protein